MLTKMGQLRVVGSGLLLATAASVGFLVFAPAKAESALNHLASFICSDHRSCLTITNSSKNGKAIEGVAQDNAGIFGRININKNTNPHNVHPANGGVHGVDASTNLLDSNAGVLGESANGNGVAGITTFDSSVNGYGNTGVEGFDYSKTVNSNAATYGSSNKNSGVFGITGGSLGTGVLGLGFNGGTGGLFQAVDTASNPSAGLGGFANYGIGVFASNTSSSSSPSFNEALHVENLGTGPLLRGFNKTQEVISLDNAGNMILAGNIQTGGTPTSVGMTSTGRSVITYEPQASIQTIEDVGEVQVVRGQAVVRLDPTFASAIDSRAPYLVFITPLGDTNGLYVAQKTASGFVVREHGGASNVAFDYRIVARPYGSRAPRLPLYTASRVEARATARAASVRRLLLQHIRPPREQSR
jgi:hypothetical protein